MAKKKPIQNTADIIQVRRKKAAMKAEYFHLIGRIFLIFLAVYLIFTQLFFVHRIAGNGMFPAIKDGDIVIGYRLESTYDQNDVVSYRFENKTYLGRIIGRANDIITIDDTGNLLVNGTTQGGEIAFATFAEDTSLYPFKVPENSVFVLGDYRTQTLDSRNFGPIPSDDVEGKVISLLRRRGI